MAARVAAVPHITGLHHVSLPVMDVMRAGDWFERVLGFSSLLIREEEDRVTTMVLRHPAGVLLQLRHAPEQCEALRLARAGMAVLGLSVADRPALEQWAARLTGLAVQHSEPYQAHLGWAMDMTGPDHLGIQLHTREDVSDEGA
jgi:glyoxylase I family protein